jgi:hypothetical protein
MTDSAALAIRPDGHFKQALSTSKYDYDRTGKLEESECLSQTNFSSSQDIPCVSHN